MAEPKDLLGSSFWSSLVALRREVHMHPEPGFQEVRTQQRVREVLTKTAGIPDAQIRVAAITGLIVDIKGTAPPKAEAAVKCVALRSDLDALTMTEGNTALPYRSKNQGVAHMCGHDGHLTALCGAAMLLQSRANRIPSNMTVRLLFQPAEESTPPGTAGFDFAKTGGGGAVPMIWDGCLEGVDEIYGWHNWPAWPLGDLRVAVGPVMAHATTFNVTITGRGGHGSQPHATIDPVVCGAAVVSALQTIVSRSLPSFSNAVVTVAQFHAGERNNVIPDEAKLSGTIRDVNDAVSKTINKRFADLVNSICKGYGCTAEIDFLSQYPCVDNHEAGVEVVKRCASTLKGDLAVKLTSEGLPMMGAEDFSYFLKERPGCFFFLGTQELLTRGLASYDGEDEKPRSNCICHGTTFDFNDNVLPRITTMLIRLVEDRLGLELYTQEEVLAATLGANGARAGGEEPGAKRQKQ